MRLVPNRAEKPGRGPRSRLPSRSRRDAVRFEVGYCDARASHEEQVVRSICERMRGFGGHRRRTGDDRRSDLSGRNAETPINKATTPSYVTDVRLPDPQALLYQEEALAAEASDQPIKCRMGSLMQNPLAIRSVLICKVATGALLVRPRPADHSELPCG